VRLGYATANKRSDHMNKESYGCVVTTHEKCKEEINIP
jgi:hypothetical protein